MVGDVVHRLDPTQRALFECGGVEPGQDAPQGIVRRDAVGQVEEAGEPGAAVGGELLDGGEGVGAGEDAADGMKTMLIRGCLRVRSTRGSWRSCKWAWKEGDP